MSGNRKSKRGKHAAGMHTMDLIMAFLGVAVVAFTVIMIHLFMVYGSIPDSLCYAFFGAVTGEAGFMGWIKTAKEKAKKTSEDRPPNDYEMEDT